MERRREAADRAAETMVAGLMGLIGLVIYAWLARVPLPVEAAALATGRQVIAYNAEGDRPRLLFEGNGRLTVGELERSWAPVASFDRPSWSIRERIVGYSAANQPASLFALDCPVAGRPCADASVILGTVTEPSIQVMEVAIDGGWRRFLVWPPGFVLPIAVGERVGDARWLTSDGRVIHAVDRDGDGQIAPLLPGETSPVTPRNW